MIDSYCIQDIFLGHTYFDMLLYSFFVSMKFKETVFSTP
jgi:hypothetical protein